MENKLDKEFKHRLEKETAEVTRLKEETWNKINQELFPEDIKKTNWVKGIMATLGTVAVAAIMFFGLLSGGFLDQTKDDPVQNDPTQGTNDPDAIGSKDDDTENDPENTEEEIPLEDQFEQEKEVEIEVEGMKEPVQVQLATNEAWRYIIYFDKDRFQFTSGEEMDEIVFTEELDDQFPEVGMEIKKVTDLSTEEAITNAKKSLASDGMTVLREEAVDWPIEAVMIEGIEGDRDDAEWNTPKHRYYIAESDDESLFMFKQKFFSVGSEGVGMRFDWMLESFEVVE